MTQPASLRFVPRFRSGTLGTLVIDHIAYDEGRHGPPGPLTYTWNGPQPPHDAHTIAARTSAARTSTETDVRLQQLLDLAADPCPDVREIALADIAREFPKYL